MRSFVTMLLILSLPAVLSAQVYIDEDFSGGGFPPQGWTIDSHSTNWSGASSNNAGGDAPEVEFSWSPSFNGTSRLISPQVDLTGVTSLKVEFRHMVDYYATPFTVGVATRSGGGAWHIVWQTSPTGNVPAHTVTQDINNSDVGAPDFQICWFFSGNSYNIDYWYFDNIVLLQPFEHDVRVQSILVDGQVDPGEYITPSAIVENYGLSTETFSVTCDISVGGGIDYSDSVTSITLHGGETQTVEFADYLAAASNDLFEVSVRTHLTGDLNPDNDLLIDWFNTYTTPRDMVALEIGTGTWCQYCPGAAMGAEDLVDNDCDVAVVEYHQGDNFENAFGLARIDYYGITGYPTAVFDGVEKFIGGSNNQSMYSYYLPIYQDRKAINSAFTIDVFGDNVGNDYDLTVRVARMATIPYDNIKLFVVLTESDIPFNWYGLDHLDWVERLVIPSSDGTPIDMMANDVLDVDLGFTMNTSWDIESCELTVFIQNVDDKEILQGTKLMVLDLTQLDVGDDAGASLPAVTTLKGNYPNPFNASSTIKYSLSQEGMVTIKLFDILGREIATLVNGREQAGEHSVTVDASELGTGVYFYRMDTENFSETKKMLLIK